MLQMNANDPEWAAGAGMKFITSGNFSGSSAVNITGLSSTYRAYKVFLYAVVGSTSTSIGVRTSTDGGSSYDAGGSDYQWNRIEGLTSGTTVSGSNSTAAAQMELAFYSGTAGQLSNSEFTIFAPSAAAKCSISCVSASADGATVTYTVTSHGVRNTAADVDAVSFIPLSGTFSGSYAVFGVV
jgi:hypothetical protein